MSLIRQQTEDQEYDYLFKIIIIGDSGVGKTNLLTRFARNEFTFDSKPTIGVEFTAKTKIMNDKNIKMQLWDTAGQERYRAITKAYYKGALGAMIVFDLTRAPTLLNIKKWFDEIKLHSDPNIAILMVGNKSDLIEERAISKEDATKSALENQAAYIETSALTQENVSLAFEQLNEEIFSRFSTSLEEQRRLHEITVKIEETQEEKPEKKRCC